MTLIQTADLDIIQDCNKNELNYFVYGLGVEPYNNWEYARKKIKLAQLTDAEKSLIESFCKDIKGESYERTVAFWSRWYLLRRCSDFRKIKQTPAAIRTSTLRPNFTGREFDETFSKTMRKMWVQFAKAGNPSLSAEISPDGKAKV